MSLIEYNTDGFVGILKLNDPDQLNAMSERMAEEFQSAINKIQKENKIRTLVLTGAGRAFSSGGHMRMLKNLQQESIETIQNRLLTFYKSFLCISDLHIPTIAAVNGHAIGAGFCLAMACDLKFASNKAKLGANFAKIGIAAGMAGNYLLSHLTTPTVAAEILFTAKIWKSEELEKRGLINYVTSPQQLENYSLQMAKEISENAPLALRAIKRGLGLSNNPTLEEQLHFDAKEQAITIKSQDFKKGLAAIKTKTTPIFLGN